MNPRKHIIPDEILLLSEYETYFRKHNPIYLKLFEKPFYRDYALTVQRIMEFDCGIECEYYRSERNFILKTILIEKYHAIYIKSLELAKQVSENRLGNGAYINACVAAMNEMVHQYESKIYAIFIDEYGDTGDLIYKLVYLDKKVGFKPRHNVRIKQNILELLNFQENSKFPVSLKLGKFLTACQHTFDMSYFELEVVIGTLNGNLTFLLEKARKHKKEVQKRKQIIALIKKERFKDSFKKFTEIFGETSGFLKLENQYNNLVENYLQTKSILAYTEKKRAFISDFIEYLETLSVADMLKNKDNQPITIENMELKIENQHINSGIVNIGETIQIGDAFLQKILTHLPGLNESGLNEAEQQFLKAVGETGSETDKTEIPEAMLRYKKTDKTTEKLKAKNRIANFLADYIEPVAKILGKVALTAVLTQYGIKELIDFE